MPMGENNTTRGLDSRSATGVSGRGPGAWLDWPRVLTLCQLELRPPSRWNVFLAILLTSARYGGRDASLKIADLCRMTGLSPRTVNAALADLFVRKLLVHPCRYGSLRVVLPEASTRGAAKVADPMVNCEIGRSADEVARPGRKLDCTSPTTPYVSVPNEDKSRKGFTTRQRSLIEDILSESTELLGSDSGGLMLPEETALSLGLNPQITYGQAFELLAVSGNPVVARDFTGAILSLRHDERVQGRELTTPPKVSQVKIQKGPSGS